MAVPSIAAVSGFSRATAIFDMPFLFKNNAAAEEALDGELGDYVAAALEESGFHVLGYFTQGLRHLTCNVEARNPSDMKGVKIRTMDSQMAIDMMTALGGSSQVMSYSEIYTGMQQGNVDGAENNVTALRDHADVTKYYCFDEHTRIPDIIVISSNIWNKMSDNQKQIMQDTAAKMTEDYKTAWADFENEVLEAATSGSNPVELIRDVDTAAFQEACQPIYTNLQTSDPAVYAYVERIQEAGK